MLRTVPKFTAAEIEQFRFQANRRLLEKEREARIQALRTGTGEDPSGGSLIHALPPDFE